MLDQHLQSVLLSAGLIALFGFGEIFWPAGRGGGLRGPATNILIGIVVGVFAVACGVLLQFFVAFVPRNGLIGLMLGDWRPPGATGIAVSVAVYGVSWDFFQYWFHRWQHESALLWPSHRVHHSDATVNTTTALRRSVLELFLIFALVMLPTVAVAGVEPLAATIAFAIFYGWGFFNHANIRFPLGPLTPVLSGPQWHRLHHGVDRDCRDRNYAAYFPILDIAFGTYRAPQPREFPATGIAGGAPDAWRDCLLPRAERRAEPGRSASLARGAPDPVGEPTAGSP